MEEHLIAFGGAFGFTLVPNPEVTSRQMGKIAAKGLHNPGALSLEEIQAVCASALTQRPDAK